jgi:hypothetical protein
VKRPRQDLTRNEPNHNAWNRSRDTVPPQRVPLSRGSSRQPGDGTPETFKSKTRHPNKNDPIIGHTKDTRSSGYGEPFQFKKEELDIPALPGSFAAHQVQMSSRDRGYPSIVSRPSTNGQATSLHNRGDTCLLRMSLSSRPRKEDLLIYRSIRYYYTIPIRRQGFRQGLGVLVN